MTTKFVNQGRMDGHYAIGDGSTVAITHQSIPGAAYMAEIRGALRRLANELPSFQLPGDVLQEVSAAVAASERALYATPPSPTRAVRQLHTAEGAAQEANTEAADRVVERLRELHAKVARLV